MAYPELNSSGQTGARAVLMILEDYIYFIKLYVHIVRKYNRQ